MEFWAGFSKYVGIQGIIALLMLIGYVAAPYTGVILPEGYTELMSLVFGFYFAKNGVGVLASFRKNP
jgi:hypothetical protein